jgi:hypothetical protein
MFGVALKGGGGFKKFPGFLQGSGFTAYDPPAGFGEQSRKPPAGYGMIFYNQNTVFFIQLESPP